MLVTTQCKQKWSYTTSHLLQRFSLWQTQLEMLVTSDSVYYPQRLLHETDWVIYMDSDTLVLSSLLELWNYQHNMNETHLMASAYKDFGPNSYHDNTTRSVPIVQPWGLYLVHKCSLMS